MIRSNTPPKSSSGRTHDQQKFILRSSTRIKKNHSQVDHTTNIFLRRNTDQKSFSERTVSRPHVTKSLSGRTGTAKIILRSHTRPKTFRLRPNTRLKSFRLRSNSFHPILSQVENMAKIFLRSNTFEHFLRYNTRPKFIES